MIRINFIPELVLYKLLGESDMAAYFAIKCPLTRRQISIGRGVNVARRNRAISFTGYTWCPHCGRDHEWSARDIILCEEAPRVPAAGRERAPPLFSERLRGPFTGVPYLRYS